MAACQIDTIACPPSRRTFNPDGSRIREQTAEEKAAEEKVFERGKRRWGDRVGRRPTPPPAPPQPPSPTHTSNTNTSTSDTQRTDTTSPLLPDQQRSKPKSGLLARVFGLENKESEEKKKGKRDAYIAAAASWGGDGDGNGEGKGEGEGVRRERLGKRSW